jgi:DNA primase
MILIDIPSLLGRLGIKAERKGREFWAPCPFHKERTPSWQIHDDSDSDKHGRWRCLGACHDGGGAVGLVMRLVGFERASEAVAWLKDGGSIEVDRGASLVAGGAMRLEAAVRPSAKSFHLPLGVRFVPFEEWPFVARAYAESRGLDARQVDRWGLGYAADGRLAGRIVLPWRASGRLGGYTARSYVPGTVKKHLEPKAEEGAATGWVYGEEHWPALAERQRAAVVVVEGGFDGFAVERASGMHFGAARGSNLLPGHVARLATWGEVILATDPDAAGQRFRGAVVSSLARHATVRHATFPDGFDPAKLERRSGPHALRACLLAAR